MFAELERKIADKRAAGIDVISLGIGDPDIRPIRMWSRRCRRPWPTGPTRTTRATGAGKSSARPSRTSTADRFGVEIDPETEVIPAIGAKECIYNLCFAFLDPGDVALASDPGYPVYTGGPILAGAEAVLLPLKEKLGFAPDLDAIDAQTGRTGTAALPELPEQPVRGDRARRILREGR